MVFAIIGILAAIALPSMRTFKPNVTAAATRQLLEDVARARQLAISQRTTVYMVFVPAGFWTDTAYNAGGWTPAELAKATNLFDKQLIGYAFLSLRSVGDQPGRPRAQYLSPWKTLPDGVFIPPQKFVGRPPNPQPVISIYTNNPGGTRVLAYQIYGFNTNTIFPFPSDQTPPAPGSPPRWVNLPYIGFDYMGQLTSGQNELIPLAQGSVLYERDSVTGAGAENFPALVESPAGNSSNAFNLVNIEWLTGRARVEHQEVR